MATAPLMSLRRVPALRLPPLQEGTGLPSNGESALPRSANRIHLMPPQLSRLGPCLCRKKAFAEGCSQPGSLLSRPQPARSALSYPVPEGFTPRFPAHPVVSSRNAPADPAPSPGGIHELPKGAAGSPARQPSRNPALRAAAIDVSRPGSLGHTPTHAAVAAPERQSRTSNGPRPSPWSTWGVGVLSSDILTNDARRQVSQGAYPPDGRNAPAGRSRGGNDPVGNCSTAPSGDPAPVQPRGAQRPRAWPMNPGRPACAIPSRLRSRRRAGVAHTPPRDTRSSASGISSTPQQR